MVVTLDTHDPRDPRSLKALAIAAEAGHDVSYRGEICRAASCYLQQEASRFKDAGMPEWSHRFERDAELLRMRADREDDMEQTATIASRRATAA